MPPDILSVSDSLRHIKTLIERDDLLQSVTVSGEISELSRASSGHWYFTLKDAKAKVSAVAWRSTVARIRMNPQVGDAVVVRGKFGIYEPQGKLQLYVDAMRPAGVGNLYEQFEALKQQLADEGLFDVDHKQPLPAFPRRIGVVTSPDAAAFQDVLNVLRRRFPLAEVMLSATLVQGQDAPPQIVHAIERLDRADVDVMLLVRGGGSIEDLWAFNDEAVARAVYAAQTPIVTGVGHETDFTVVDFVADYRAPTPSAAAEVVTPDVAELRALVAARHDGLRTVFAASLDRRRESVRRLDEQRRYHSPQSDINRYRQSVDDRVRQLNYRGHGQLERLRERLQGRYDALEAASPHNILRRGYVLVTDADTGAVVRHADDADAGQSVTLTFSDGKRNATIEDNS
jgi:exodeoxyribonuclease VII large subunit